MNNITYIDDYFNNPNTEEQKKVFEQRIMEDMDFAKEVAFYITTTGIIKEQIIQQKKLRFKEIYQAQKLVTAKIIPLKTVWRYIAAASVVAVIILFSWLLNKDRSSAQQLADKYVQKNFITMGVTMGSKQDSLQTGLNLLNEGKLTAALSQFENMIKNDSTDAFAKKNAGIVSLRLKKYDIAIQYFTSLEADTSLYSNPGKFYKAITLLERNKMDDEAHAKTLLEAVVTQNLEGKETAIQWLRQL